LNDETVKGKLASAKKLSEVNAEGYDAIFYVGGHGPVIDLAQDAVNIKLASQVSFTFWLRILDQPRIVLSIQQNRGSSLPWTCVRYTLLLLTSFI